MRRGIVIKSSGSDYLVRLSDGELLSCKIKGNFRIKGIKSTNPLAVGDHVGIDAQMMICEIEDRKNYIVRKPTNLSKQLHIIAANIDQALLVVTVKHPETSTVFIDRFLATSEAYRIPAILVFNKVDTYSDDELEYVDALIHLYTTIGYNCLKLSALNGDGLTGLEDVMRGKISLLSGNSGVGKSTIINRMVPHARTRTAEVSDYHHKGMHTTTFSEMYELPDNSFLIDTPGIKGFGVIDMTVEEVGHFFPEIFEASQHCRFNNCTHRHEPNCAVQQALEEHTISQSRYQSYMSILNDLTEGKYR